MPNQVPLKELKILARQLNVAIYGASCSRKKRVKGSWFKTEILQDFIWTTKPNLDNVAAYYTLVAADNEDKEVDTYPAKIRYIHWSDVILFQLKLGDKIDKIQKSAIKIDEADEAYIIIKYL